MKTKLLFLTLVLNIATTALYAAPMLREPERESTRQQEEDQQYNRDATNLDETVTRSDDVRGTEFLKERKNITETKILSPSETDSEAVKFLIESLTKTHNLLKQVINKESSDVREWELVSLNIRKMKNGIQDIISPPSPSMVDTFLGRLPKVSTPQEIEKAKILQPQVLALEAALPARKQNVIASSALKKASEYQDEEIFQKAVEAEVAWKKAQDNFHGHIEQLPEGLKNDILDLWLGIRTISEITDPVAQVWASQIKYLEHAEKFSARISEEMRGLSPKTVGKILILNLELLEAQKRAESTMAVYTNKYDDIQFDVCSKAIDELASLHQQIDQLILMGELPEAYKETWRVCADRLTYVTTAYYCNLHNIKFWNEYEKLNQINHSDTPEEQLVASYSKIHRQGIKTANLFQKAIDAKKALISPESLQKIEDENRLEALSREEERVKKRLIALNEERNEVLKVIFPNSSSSNSIRLSKDDSL